MTDPLEFETDALSLPEVRAAFEESRQSPRRGVLAAHGRAMIASALDGVPLGGYEERILLDWFPKSGVQACAAVAAVIRRARDEERAVRLLERVLHLRMNGERAPGGGETWAPLDGDIEDFLRRARGMTGP